MHKKSKGVEIMTSTVRKEQMQSVDYEKIVNSPEFIAMAKRKKGFIGPYVIFFLAAYFMLPMLTGFSHVLETKAIGPITWTWVYSFAMFIMTWTFSMIYAKKFTSFDKEAEEIIAKNILN